MMDKALHNLRPFAVWTINGEHEYSNLVWLDPDQTKPTEEEVVAEVARLQAEYEAQEYQRQRAAEYPSFADQFDLLYHGGYDAWKAAIDAVKTKYPKE
jgi:rhodanese-related sulfurtransferase